MHQNINLRHELKTRDKDEIKNILTSTNFFSSEEIDVAIELVDDRLSKKELSHYQFIIAEYLDKAVGYACYGRIPFTEASYDIYWIAVHEDVRRKKIGKVLISATEEMIKQKNGKQIFVETSSREQYKSTRDFYIQNAYQEQSVYHDFYKDGEHKVVYVKKIVS